MISIKPTEFMCIDTDGEITILDSKEIPIGTLIGGDNIEAFHVLTFDDDGKPWVLTTNLQMSYEAFAQMMRSQCTLPKIIHWAAKYNTWRTIPDSVKAAHRALIPGI